jgi:hypothetical protein
MLVDFIAQQYGEETLGDLIHRLGTGTPFKRAVQEATGDTVDGLYDQWHAWVLDNLDTLDEAS